MRIEFLKRRLAHEILHGRDPVTIARLVRDLNELMNVGVVASAADLG